MKHLCLLLLLLPGLVQAGDVEVKHVKMVRSGSSWHVSVTIRHDDAGWKHYANGWRVVGMDGKVYGTRVLYHPHDRDPFTRSHRVKIPAGVTKVYIEARDKVHGWSADRVVVDLGKSKGDRYEVRR